MRDRRLGHLSAVDLHDDDDRRAAGLAAALAALRRRGDEPGRLSGEQLDAVLADRVGTAGDDRTAERPARVDAGRLVGGRS